MAAKTTIQAVKGTRDFYPEAMAFRTWLYEQVRSISERFGYQEWEGPLLERLELYAAKSGEELVKEQSYIGNPSWCSATGTTYRAPAFSNRSTQASGSHFSARNIGMKSL